MKLWKAAEHFEVNTEMTVARDKIKEEVVVKLCQRVLDGKRISNERKTLIVVPMYKG